jgi:hypothetical protein
LLKNFCNIVFFFNFAKWKDKKITIYIKIIKIMKKLLLSLTMLSIICVSSAKVNNVYDGDDQIKKSVEKYAKDSLAKKYNQYKGVSTIIADTIKINEFIKGDSIGLNILKENELSPFVMVNQREMLNQEIQLRKRVSPNTIDYKTIKMYQKPDLKVSTLLKASKENNKKLNPNGEAYALIHTFEYVDKKGFTISDSAMFIYSPQDIRIITNATKFNKGINYTGTLKEFKSYILEQIEKLPKPQRQSQNQQPKNKE